MLHMFNIFSYTSYLYSIDVLFSPWFHDTNVLIQREIHRLQKLAPPGTVQELLADFVRKRWDEGILNNVDMDNLWIIYG